jgi:two-component system response regulator MprA
MGLTYEGFSVATAEDGPSALEQFHSFKPHLVILDLMLPGIDGLDLADRFRRDPDILIIMLTARDQVADRVLGLKAGADDYVVKPFDFEELLARIHAVARRQLATQDAIELTLKEYELLRLFMLNPRRVLPRQMILDRVWGYDFFGNENNVEVYVGYLRRKLEDPEHELIQTVRGVGYRLNV